MRKTIVMLSVTLLIAGCAIQRAETTHADTQSDAERRLIELRREEIHEIQEEVVTLHKILMIVGESDDAYRAKLEETQRMPPDDRVLGDLPSDLVRLDAIKMQLGKKIKRYRDLLVIGNAGY